MSSLLKGLVYCLAWDKALKSCKLKELVGIDIKLSL